MIWRPSCAIQASVWQKSGKGLPYRRNKPSDRITTRFLFELFPRVQTVPFTVDGGPTQKKLVPRYFVWGLSVARKSSLAPIR